MGKRGSNKRESNSTAKTQVSMTLREESRGRKQTNTNPKSILKLQHIKNLAVWASGEASIPSLGAFFGQHLAACGEAIGTLPDPSLFACERCESILQPGYNCTVRIEKSREKKRYGRRKVNNLTQNNVVSKCQFCFHRNLKRGTPRGHMKEICPSKAKPSSKSEPAKSKIQKPALEKEMGSNVEKNKIDRIASPAIAKDDPVTSNLTTPVVKSGSSLLEGKGRKRSRSGAKKPAEPESSTAEISTSSKRKRKSWRSLKEIAGSSELGSSRNLANLSIPFLL